MKIIKPSANIIKHDCDPYKLIERVGRTCYKSEDKIEEGSDLKFLKNLLTKKHHAMLEHEHIYLHCSYRFLKQFIEDMTTECYPLRFFNITLIGNDPNLPNLLSGSFRSFIDLFIGAKKFSNHEEGNYHTIVELADALRMKYPEIFWGELTDGLWEGSKPEFAILTREHLLEGFSEDTAVISKHLIHTVKFVCDRGVSHELVRHRVASFAQESTRYCNYNKDEEIVVIEPFFFKTDGVDVKNNQWAERYGAWRSACEEAENSYLRIIRDGGTPQEARSVLPNSLKTEIIVTAVEEEWQHIINLRYIGTTGAPHPQMKEVMAFAVNDLVRESEGRLKYE